MFLTTCAPARRREAVGNFGNLVLRLDSKPCYVIQAKACDSGSSETMVPHAKFRVIEASGMNDEISKTETFLEKARV